MRWGAAVPASRCTLRSFTSEAEIRRRRQNGSAPALKGHDIITPPPLSQFRNCDRNGFNCTTEIGSASTLSQDYSPQQPLCHSFDSVTGTPPNFGSGWDWLIGQFCRSQPSSSQRRSKRRSKRRATISPESWRLLVNSPAPPGATTNYTPPCPARGLTGAACVFNAVTR